MLPVGPWRPGHAAGGREFVMRHGPLAQTHPIQVQGQVSHPIQVASRSDKVLA
jgi:hypothetical protein